ncbi:ABC transporter ATP-binding protein [Shimia marina]|uniref:Aliphatic sulfonates import ATP-binding protein SsuB n=1 Tax=Shimia marina TaxID=321267 RepID=A0A0P1F9Q5_9RHOB|nr:ABC transporter ATP-binding protein [Shimia marina]CUH51142.1 Aliphatic sulfonates import ATP-binding protein SsuB [Shimia marina]SFD57024.1 putative hydroxymethylpyrimidine transport system ATP-binding protein [Shimia marina]
MSMAPGITLKGSATIEGRQLFAPLSLTLDAGRWTCLLGGSGVGKTTVLRLLADLPTGAAFDGTIAATDELPVAERIAYMAQSDLLLPWASVEKNITLGARLRGQTGDAARLEHLLDRCGLQDHRHKKPTELSGGQRQRVALARTLMEDKPIILLDEPFSALDAQTRAAMQDLAVELLEGRTVMMVTHDPGEAARLGHAIHVMTATQLQAVTPPQSSVPRAVEALDTLTCQSALLKLLMEQVA